MSYTNETTHYSIPLPLGSDLTTPMDYNTAMQAVDTDLYDAKTTSASASSVANNAKDAVDNITNNVIGGQNGIDARLTTVEGTVSTQGTAITNLGLRVDDVKADAMDMICAKDEGTAQVATVAVDKGEYFRYNDVLYIGTADIHIGDTIVPNTNCKATNVATVLEEISSGGEVTANDVTYNHTTSGLSATKVQQAIDELKGLIDQIGGGGMPNLNYTTPLHTFTSNNLTFTATKECYLLGTCDALATEPLKINNTDVFKTNNSSAAALLVVPLIKLSAGDVVTIARASDSLHVYDVVS